MTIRPQFFDAHFHVIDRRFPLYENNGYIPEDFTVDQYGFLYALDGRNGKVI